MGEKKKKPVTPEKGKSVEPGQLPKPKDTDFLKEDQLLIARPEMQLGIMNKEQLQEHAGHMVEKHAITPFLPVEQDDFMYLQQPTNRELGKYEKLQVKMHGNKSFEDHQPIKPVDWKVLVK